MPKIDLQSQIEPLQFTAECADFWRSLKELFGAYRPERYYMRGPGPKWHAKHKGAFVERNTPAIAPSRARVTHCPSYDGLDTAAIARTLEGSQPALALVPAATFDST